MRLVLQCIPFIGGGQQTLPTKSEWDSAGVYRDPPTTPLLCNVCSRSAAASWVKYKVARIGGHQNAPLYCCRPSLHNVNLWVRAALDTPANVVPGIGYWTNWKVFKKTLVSNRVARLDDTASFYQTMHSRFSRLPLPPF